MNTPAPRHIALLLPELEAGGAQRVMLLLAREFAARGHEVDLVLLRATGALLADVPSGVRLVDLAARPHGLGQLGFSLSSVRRLAAWLRAARPDAMLASITGANLVAVIARGLARIPMRLAIREAGAVTAIGSAVRRRCMSALYPHADAVIALSPVMAEQLASHLAVPSKRICCIPNPVDAPLIRERGRAPLSHPWLDDAQFRVVIAVGRLIPQKDYATLLRAFALLPAAGQARLLIVGEGPERPRLEALANELGIQDRVQLAGFDANPWRWMARADLFALSSVSEGHPNVLLEAIALGLPAVATEYDASLRAMIPSAALHCVPPQQPQALADCIERVLLDTAKPAASDVEPPHQTADRYLRTLFA